MDANMFSVLRDLHFNIYREELLGQDFTRIVQYILKPRERQILELKIQGVKDGEIGRQLMIKVSTVKRCIYHIKRKFRNDGIDSRVDDKIRKYKFNRGLHLNDM